jgi:hypothetical protein
MQNLRKALPFFLLAALLALGMVALTMPSTASAATATSPFPKGMGVWKWTSAMGPWMLQEGVTWYQYWNGALGDKGKPYIFEIKTGAYSDATIQGWIKNRGPHCIGVDIDCEMPKTARTASVTAMVRKMAPGLKVFSGNMDWQLKPQNFWNWTDGIMCFYNCTRKDRCAADVFYFIALSKYYGKPLCFSVQGQDAEGVPPASVTEFKTALTYATNAEGQIIWPGDRLAVNNWTAVNAALKSYPHDGARPVKVVRLSGNQLKDMALCRIVAYKGFLPVGSTTSGVTWTNVTVPSNYFSNLSLFHNGGSTKAWIITTERNLVVHW